jgi:hypothetical protein
MLQLRGKPQANCRDCSKWKEAKAALVKQVPNQRNRTSGAAVQPAANRVVTPQPFADQESIYLVGTMLSEEVVLLRLPPNPS